MDSLFKGRLPDHSKQQLFALLNFRNKNVKINVLPVEQQTNGVDCGHVDIFCSCRMPWKRNEKNIYEKQMAEWCSCK